MRIAECGRRRPVVRPGAARGFVPLWAARTGLGTTGAGLGTTGPTPEEIGRGQRPRAPVRRPRQNHRLARTSEFVRRRNLRSDTSIRTTDAVATEAARGVARRMVSYLRRGLNGPSLAIPRRSEVPPQQLGWPTHSVASRCALTRRTGPWTGLENESRECPRFNT